MLNKDTGSIKIELDGLTARKMESDVPDRVFTPVPNRVERKIEPKEPKKVEVQEEKEVPPVAEAAPEAPTEKVVLDNTVQYKPQIDSSRKLIKHIIAAAKHKFVHEVRQISFIADYEEHLAKELMEKQLGFELMQACGYQVVVRVYNSAEGYAYVKDENGNFKLDEHGKPTSIVLSKSVVARGNYTSVVGLVISRGDESYMGKRFKKGRPWCRVGDFVVIPATDSHQMSWKGLPIRVFPDDRVLFPIKDPNDITRDIH